MSITAPRRLSHAVIRRRIELEHLLKHCHWFVHDEDYFFLRYHGLPEHAPQPRDTDAAPQPHRDAAITG